MYISDAVRTYAKIPVFSGWEHVSPEQKKFGEIAVEKGFASQEDVNKALKIQKELRENGEKVLIGIIMLTNEMLTNEQLIDILKSYE